MIYCQTGRCRSESRESSEKIKAVKKYDKKYRDPRKPNFENPYVQEYNNFYILLRKTGLEPVRKQYALDP